MIKKALIYINAMLFLAQPSFSFATGFATAKDVINLHSAPSTARLFYGSSPLEFGDLRLPTTKGAYPVAIIIHGGCWLNKVAGVDYMNALSDALRDSGIATWNIEYNGVDSPEGGWPGTFNDVANAADFLRTIKTHYHLDLNRVVVIGHSAGGQLALWLAARHKIQQNSPLYTINPLNINGVIILGGVPDIKTYRSQCLKICGYDPMIKLAPRANIYQQVMPSALLPLNVPQIFIYGTDDRVVPARYSLDYIRSALKKGDKVKLILVRNAAHHEYNVPMSVVWPKLLNSVNLLIKQPTR